MVDLIDIADPVAVWKAVEGDTTDLIALLRSEKRLGVRTRDALADWLEGKLEPVKLPKGRPLKASNRRAAPFAAWHLWHGHDLTTPMGGAGFRYEHLRRFIRKKGWHKKSAGKLYWSQDRLRKVIAAKHELDLEKFINYLNRPRPKPRPQPWSGPGYIEWRRRCIAYEVHHTKKRSEG